MVEAKEGFRPRAQRAWERALSCQGIIEHIVARLMAEPEVRKDLCEDALLRLYLKLLPGVPKVGLKICAARVARDVCCGYLRKAGRRPPVISLEEVVREASAQPEAPTWEPIMFHMHVSSAIASLSPGLREVAVPCLLEGLSLPEVAKALKISPRAAKERLKRAKKTLREALRNDVR